MNLYKSLAEQLAAALRPVQEKSKTAAGGHHSVELSGQDIVNAFIALSDYDHYVKEQAQ